MTEDQKTAIKAMLYAFDRYGANRLCGSTFIPDGKNHPNYMMGFGEAYYICRKMIDRDNEKDMTSIEKILERYCDGLIGEDIALQCIKEVIDEENRANATNELECNLRKS